MNNLQMSLGNSKHPLRFTLGNIELSFSDKCCKRCHAPKKFWIPPPGRTTKLCQCCWKKLPEPPTRYTVNVPANELLKSNTPFIIESSNIENFKMLFLPEATAENSQNTPKTPFEKILESFNMQKSVIQGAEKVLEDNEKMRNTLSENVKSLKNNMNDIGQRINEISNKDEIIKEDINVTEISSTKSNQTKSVATVAKRREIALKRKSTKDTLRSEILRVENLLKNVQKLTESKLSKEASLKVKTLETINTFETDQTDSDRWVREDFDKNNIKTLAEKSTTYELIQSLRLPPKNTKNKSIQTNFLRPVPMIKFQTAKKPHSIRQNRYMKHRAIAIHPKKALKEAVITPNKSIKENIQNHATVEHLMKKLADSMRKSKKLLDSVYRQDGIVESMQNKFINQVEKLYQEQQSMLKDLYEVSKSSIDPNTSDISSPNESIEHYQQGQPSLRFPRGNELEEHSPPNERIDSNGIQSFCSEEVAEDMHTIEETLAKAQEKLIDLKKEYKETTKLLLNGSTTENNLVNKSADRYKPDSGYSTMNKIMPREKPDGRKVDNDIMYETVIKQTLRNVTIPELTQSNIHSPLAQSIQNINQAATQLLPSYSNNISWPENGMTAIEGPLDSSQSLEETTKKSVRVSDQFKRQSPVTKPASGRFNYTGKPSSLESFGPLSEYPFNITESYSEESLSRQKKISPSSSFYAHRNRLPEYHEWAENKPQDFSTPKAGRLKTSDHEIEVSDEDTLINNHPHHYHHRHHVHHKTHQDHHHDSHNQHHDSNNQHHDSQNQHHSSHNQHHDSHNQHHDSHNQHHGSHNQHHGSHNQHHGSHNQHHNSHNEHHDTHNSPEHHTEGHPRHNLRRLRRKIDKLYEDIMSS